MPNPPVAPSRPAALLALLVCALAGFWIGAAGLAAAEPSRLSIEEARHLASRTGFGATPEDLRAYAGLSRAAAVDRILAGLRTRPSTPPPAWATAPFYPGAGAFWSVSQTLEELYGALREEEIHQLRLWWTAEMVETPSPLTERLTLFWHDHFATRFTAHEDPQWAARQHLALRRLGSGDFRALARAMLRDPGLLTFLSNTENAKDAPNENLAREWFELFTLGQGVGYRERDVKEAARALTGAGYDEITRRYRIHGEDHDRGAKTILGRRGRFGPDALVDLTLDHPAFGPHIVEKLWREFVSDRPDPAEVARLTQVWKRADLRIKPLLRALFLTEAFWASENRGRLVKAPAVLVVGAIRSLGVAVARYEPVVDAIEEMGQSLLDPPNVGGWPGGVAWINDARVISRIEALSNLDRIRRGGDAEAGEPEGRKRGAPGMAAMVRPGAGAAPRSAPARRPVGPDDLRVGAVFVGEAERFEEGAARGIHLTLTLFDVSYGGRRWRALPIRLFAPRRAPAEFAAFLEDCLIGCGLDGAAARGRDDEGWLAIELHGAAAEDLKGAPGKDRRLLGRLIAGLPTFLARTQPHAIWRPSSDPEDEEQARRAGYRAVLRAAQRARRRLSAAGLAPKADTGEIVFAPSAPGLLGVPEAMVEAGYTLSRKRFEARAERLMEAMEHAARPRPPARRVRPIYRDAAAWLAALPSTGFASTTAERALLAVPFQRRGRRIEKVTRDPSALVRRILISPEYQLH